ncbi:pyridoxal phosphate homeostasis protein isoform X2 [Lycorma delicatula]|uniref:pyridoxal phosphate homeostasis protein isoform X2 n=1 Tax=Lycorma delicatula TaxID=130591 RepID=UPI003F50EEC0
MLTACRFQLLSGNLPVRLRFATMDEVDVVKGLQNVLDKVLAASSRRPEELQFVKPRLVAVSKTKSVDMIITAYEHGQRHFGENYIQELTEKSINPQILEKCPDICWHYIGHLQRNKAPKIVRISHLYMIETIDSDRIASAVNNSWGGVNAVDPLRIMIQVNTSGETEKSGVELSEASNLVKFVIENCPNLKFVGLMTIGEYGYDVTKGPNPDFLIELGSTNVRVGSSIFGFRAKKPPVTNSAKEEGES